jgi:hypothetical protein
MNPDTEYNKAVEALNQLYSSRTGKVFEVSSHGHSEEERVVSLKQRIYEEKIWVVFIDVLRVQTVKKKGRCGPDDASELRLTDISRRL